MGLRLKLTLPLLLLWCVLFIIFNYYWLPSFIANGVSQYRTQQEHMVSVLGDGLLEAILRGDLAQTYATLDKVVEEHKDWIQLKVWDANGQLLYPLEISKVEDSPSYVTVIHDHYYGSQLLIKLKLVADAHDSVVLQQAKVNELRWLFLSVFAIAISFSMLLEHRVVRRPLAQLMEAAIRISEMDFSARLPKAKRDEVGQLVKAFDLMRYNLQSHQEKLRQARDQALEATRVKSEFLARMSHELRTPLNAIIGYCELMEDELASEGLRIGVRDLKKIECAGHHLLTLINDILDLAKIEAGKMELHVTRFSLNALIDDVVDTIKPLAEKKRNTINVTLSPAVDLVVSDQVKVKQILFNLLSNACKFTAEGNIAVSVSASQQNGQTYFKVEVRDSGIGIEKEKLGMLFNAFTQIDSSYNRKYDGTGLGLALSRQLCQLMQGDIVVNSQPNNGSIFTFWLPSQLAKQQAA